MISKRIKYIASLIDDDKVLDIGTDHALLPIYLIKNNITKIADGSDISNEVLNNAKKNISKYNLDGRVDLYLSDGTKSVDINKYNTLVITGMGFYTIKDILDHTLLDEIDKLIIQSNNNYEETRRYLNTIGFKIVNDNYILDKNKSYLIIKAVKGKQKLSDKEYICGIYNKDNIWYYKYIIKKYRNVLKNIPDNTSSKFNLLINCYQEYLSTGKTGE